MYGLLSKYTRAIGCEKYSGNRGSDPSKNILCFSKGPHYLWGWGVHKSKPAVITEVITRTSSDTQTTQLAFLKLITNLDSLILKIYFQAAHFCFNAEPKSVQLAHYQRKKKAFLEQSYHFQCH